MNIHICFTYEELSERAADDLFHLLDWRQEPLLCLASGDSPAGLYRQMVQKATNNHNDLSNCFFVGLDEWMGMNGEDEGSCRYHLDRQFFDAIRVDRKRICFFDGKTENPEEECQRVEGFIQHHGGIHVAVLGLGMNGHIGMNEPGTSLTSRSHIAHIEPLTQQVGQKYFNEHKVLTHGLTLGLETILEAKHIFLIVSGEHKAAIVRQVLEEQISETVPATLLRSHPGLHVYLDSAAARLLSPAHE